MPRRIAFAGAFLTRNSDLWLAAGLVACGIYFFSGHFTTVRFESERIDVRVEHGRILVTGFYHYVNHSRLPAVLTLAVPFPVDRDHSSPESFSVAEVTEQGHPLADIAPLRRGGKLRFRLVFQAGESKWIRLAYVQPARVASGRYLLTTTRAWRRPIGSACFALRIPHDFELASSNYALTPAAAQGPWKAYSFCEKDLYPDRDWEFGWNEPPSRPFRAPR